MMPDSTQEHREGPAAGAGGEAAAAKVEGKVKWFNAKKGFGFIAGGWGADVFVHYSAIVGDGQRVLREGDVVEYELVQGEKGPKAAKVVKQPEAPAD